MARIGNVEFDAPILLAPMAGITDSAFRTICRKFGAAGTYTEMVSAKALSFNDKKTKTLLSITQGERPCAAQIFGSEPDLCAEAAVQALEISGADYIDINMGCPMPKIVNNGDGSALMRDLPLAQKLITAVRRKVDRPLTVKFRSGIDSTSINAQEFAKMVEACGADAICVHGRTQKQLYSGKSNFDVIMDVKNSAGIPVIASGDMFCAQDAKDALSRGVDFVMVARGAQGNPFVFREMRAAIMGQAVPPPTIIEIAETMREHVALMCARKSEERAIPEARKHLLWYLHGLRGAKPFKLKFAMVKTYDEFLEICQEMTEFLSVREL